MFSTRKAIKLSVLSLALVSASAAFADTLIVRSTGPSAKTYPAGKSLPADGKLALKADDSVTILDKAGTRVLKGPGVFALSAARTATASATLGQFLKNTGARQSRAGAVRGVNGGKASSPNLWFVDVEKSGSICVVDPAAITLWRAVTDKSQTLTLTRLSDGKSASAAFGAGVASRAWPVAEIAVADGAQFRVSSGGSTPPSLITIRKVGQMGTGLDDTASALLKSGCTAQVDLLVEKASASADGS